MTGCLSSPYWVIFCPDSLSSGEKEKIVYNIIKLKYLVCRWEKQVLFFFAYSFFAFGFDTDDRLSFGLVHNYSPLISPCQSKLILLKTQEYASVK